MKVYLVTKGEYSDYHIEGIFDNKKTAENWAKIKSTKYSEARIEEWELNTTKFKVYNYLCRISREGKILSCRQHEPELTNRKGRDIHDNYFAMGATAEEAKKNAIDYRTEQLALEEGI